MTPRIEDRLLDVAVVAKRLKCCPETIRRYIRKGLLAAVRMPGDRRQGNYRIAESTVSAFLVTRSNFLQRPSA